MKTKIVLSALALTTLITAFTLIPMPNSVKWGPAYERPGIFSYFYLAGFDSKYYYVVAKPKKDNLFMKFDYNHKLIAEKPLPFEYNEKNLPVTNVISTKDKVFAILETYDKKADLYKIFYCEISKDGNIVGTPKEVASIPYKIKYGQLMLAGYGIGKGFDSDASGVDVSEDSSKVMILKTGSMAETGKEKFNIYVYDNNFKQVWKKVTELAYTDDKLDLQQYYVSNEGIVYLTCKVWKSASEREKGVPNYDYKIIAITESGIREFPVDIGSTNLVSDAGVFFGGNDKMVIGGFYTEKGSSKYSHDGVFMVSINRKSGDVLASKAHKFTPEFLEGLLKEKAITKGKGLSRFDIYNIFTDDEEKNYMFVAEENYITTHTVTNSDGSTRTYYIYHTNEIMVPSFSENASLNWISKIEKSYSSKIPAFTSYTSGYGGKGLYLVYNDRKTKDEREESGKDAGKRAIYTDLTIIDANGKVTTETIFSNKDEDLDTYFLPSYSDFIGKNTFLLYGEKKKDFQFGTMTVN